MLSRWPNSADGTIKNQLTIFSIKEEMATLEFNRFFYNGSISMRNFNFVHNIIAFTVNRDPFLFIATISKNKDKEKKVFQYPFAYDFTKILSIVFNENATKIAVCLLKKETNIQKLLNHLLHSYPEESYTQLEERLSKSIEYGDCFIMDVK